MRKVLKRDPDSADALHILGLIAVRAKRLREAERFLQRCVQVAPGYTDAHNNLGNLLSLQGRMTEAEASYRQAARLAPRYVRPHFNLGNVLRQQQRFNEAESAYRAALSLAPEDDNIRVNLGNLMREQSRYKEAERLYREVLTRRPDFHELHLNLGNVYRQDGDLTRARTEYEVLLGYNSEHARALLSMALVCAAEHQCGEAAALIERARRIDSAPAHELHAAEAGLYASQGRPSLALEAALKAVEAGASALEYRVHIAELLLTLKQPGRALELLERDDLTLTEGADQALALVFRSQSQLCCWRRWKERAGAICARIHGANASAITPFAALSLPGLTATDLQAVARSHAARYREWTARGPLCTVSATRSDKGRPLRIGYLSADYRQHPVARLSARVFELHDRSRFEVYGYSIGDGDESSIRQRLRCAFDHFVELAELSHQEAAQRIHEDEIDILVDLGGYTAHARPEILALRPSPLQVNWLGFSGTMGADFMDYIVADRVVLPPDRREAFDEAVAYLPDSYMPFDDRRRVSPIPARSAFGLPETGIVFCCFNNAYKLSPESITVWSRILTRCPDSVLWLSAYSPDVRKNLRRELHSRGITAERIIFADKLPSYADHLARLKLADLFLDTWPYNAHSTAMEALSVGVPVLTCTGETFASRVAASLVNIARLPELICCDADDYEHRALELAQNREVLDVIRERLASPGLALFDSPRFTHSLEALYERMWQHRLNGGPPMMIETSTDVDGGSRDGWRG